METEALTSKEDTMTRNGSQGFAAAAALFAVIMIVSACGPEQAPIEDRGETPVTAMPDPPAAPTFDLVIEADAQGPEGWGVVPVIRLRPGESVRLRFAGARVWMLIPDTSLEVFGTGVRKAEGDGFTALTFGEDGVILQLSAVDAAGIREFHYSVLALEGVDKGRWSYIHGNNPPPRMIIGG
jgi:hypothetical protein